MAPDLNRAHPRRPSPRDSVSGTGHGGVRTARDAQGDRPSSPLGFASQVASAVLHADSGHLSLDAGPGVVARPPSRPLARKPAAVESTGPALGDSITVAVPLPLPPGCPPTSQALASQTSGSHVSEERANDWVSKQEDEFPGRLYNKTAASTLPKAAPEGPWDRVFPRESGSDDHDKYPSYFQDAMMMMREYERTSISSMSEDLDSIPVPAGGTGLVATEDGKACAGGDACLPPAQEDIPGQAPMSSPASAEGHDIVLLESTMGNSSTGPSIFGSPSVGSSSLVQTSIQDDRSAPSVASSRFGPHRCTDCGGTFTLAKDLKRHRKSKCALAGTTPMYRCRCGYKNSRKDAVKRHIEGSKPEGGRCEKANPEGVDVCVCGYETSAMRAFVEHICACSLLSLPRGRPRKEKP